VNAAADALFTFFDDPAFGRQPVRNNIRECHPVHSATGGSTNLIMHIAPRCCTPAPISRRRLHAIRTATPIPRHLRLLVTEGRDIRVGAAVLCRAEPGHRDGETRLTGSACR
jgi:hypothetical protein